MIQWHKVRFEVVGTIVGKGRPRFTTKSGFSRVYTPKKTKDYEELIQQCFYRTGAKKSEKALRIKIYAYKGIPKSTTKKLFKALLDKTYLCTVKPDIDNISKVVLDALNHVAYEDDTQVCELAIIKRFTDQEEKLSIIIEEIGECRPKK